MSTTAGSSRFIIHFPYARVIPGDGSRRLDFEPDEVARQTLHPTHRVDMSAYVNRPKVKEVETVVDKQHHFLVSSQVTRGGWGHSDQVAIVLDEKGDWLSLWALVAGERYARARHALQEIARLHWIDV
jgi:hypothetical protein